MKTKIEQMRDLVEKLNYYTKKYDEGNPEISDKEWDDLYFRLLKLEQLENYNYFVNSPTRTINYQVVNQLNKVEHNHKMLSLDKTKNLEDIKKFVDNNITIAMSKVDGLTCSLKYINGKLVAAETRGDGIIGEDILHNALTVRSIPHRIEYKEELIVDGEIVCLYNDFKQFEEEYKNPRNFAAGSIRLLDAKECAKRNLSFVAWEVIKGFDSYNNFNERLNNLMYLGFFTVPRIIVTKEIINQNLIDTIKNISKEQSIPIDGVVFKYNDISYGKKQGETSHHFKNAIAYKFYDETYETTLKDIDWTMGRTGILTPVAIVEPIEIDGTIIERANIHNLKIMEDLNITHIGQKVEIFKANQIIPQILHSYPIEKENADEAIKIPDTCPICGAPTAIKEDINSKFLYCSNKDCEGKLINKLDHFCGKKGLDIKGLSTATLEKLIEWNWVNSIIDIYNLFNHKTEWIQKEGFGEKSVNNILDAIEKSKECYLPNFIAAIGIPLIGLNVAKEICTHISTFEDFRRLINDKFDFSEWENFGPEKKDKLLTFDYKEADKIADTYLTFVIDNKPQNSNTLKDLKICITGGLKHYKNRKELQDVIEAAGGKPVKLVNKTTNYLINNDKNSTTAKNKTAQQLGIKILTEEEFIKQFLTN